MISAVLLLAALVMAPIIGGGFSEPGNCILQISIFAAIAVHVILSARRGRTTFARVPALAALGVFAMAVVISALFTSDLYPTLRQLLFLAGCLGAYLLAAKLAENDEVATAGIWAMLLSALGVCVVAIRNYAILTGGGDKFWHALLGMGDHLRLFGPFFNPDFFAGFLVIALPVSLAAYLVARRSLLAALAGLAVLTETAALLLTGSKFGVIAALVGLLAFFVLAIVTKSMGRRRFIRLLIAAAVLIPLVAVFCRPIVSRVHSAEGGGAQVHSTLFRLYTWKATLGMVRANPWKGVGPGAFSTVFGRYEIAGWTELAHDAYLQIAAESGVVALGAFLALLLGVAYRSLVSIVRNARANKAAAKPPEARGGVVWEDFVPAEGWPLISSAVFAALLGSAVRNLADSDWYVMGIALPFWILTGILVSRTSRSFGAGEPGFPAITLGRYGRAGVAAACGACVLLAASFGLGAAFAPDRVLARGASENAVRRYRLASALSPLDPSYHRDLAKILAFDENRPRSAMGEIDKAISLSPNDARNYYAKGIIASELNEAATAVRSLREAAKLDPKKPGILYGLAMLYRDLGETARCERLLERVLKIENTPYERVKGVPEAVDTTYAYAHYYFGRKFLKQGRYRLALYHFAKAAERIQRWRSYKAVLQVQRLSGRLSSLEERRNDELLQRSREGMRQARAELRK